MMRIALFHNLPAGGAKRHTYEQVKELKNRGHYIEEFTLSTAEHKFASLESLVDAVHVARLEWVPLKPIAIPGVGPYIHLLQNYANLQRLQRVSISVARSIDGANFDLVLAKDCMFTIAPFILRFLRTPTVFYAHTTLDVGDVEKFQERMRHSSYQRRIARTATYPAILAHKALVQSYYVQNMRCADKVLTNSRSLQQLIKQQCDVDARIIHPGIDTSTFRPAAGYRGNYVLSVGAINLAKGHRLVVEALGQLPIEARPALVIAGIESAPGEPELLTAIADRLNVDLTILNVRATSEMVKLYGNARALVVGHVYEYLGNNALEAMACGTPVVAVDPRGLVENAVDGVTGFLVGERTAEALAKGLAQLLQDPAQAETFGQQAREYVQSYWTWPRAVDDLEAQFATVIGAPA